MHPLVNAIRRNAQNEEQWAQAQRAADHLDPIMAAALACTEPDQARAQLGAAIVALYEHSRPYTGMTPAQAWIDETHRHLHARARALFGAEGWRTVPPPHHEPLPTRPAGPRSRFGA